jgi:hypothetical protein
LHEMEEEEDLFIRIDPHSILEIVNTNRPCLMMCYLPLWISSLKKEKNGIWFIFLRWIPSASVKRNGFPPYQKSALSRHCRSLFDIVHHQRN